MRKMTMPFGGTINVVEHIIVKNFWEYYVTDQKFDNDIVQCYVMGIENELGDVSMAEIKPFIISRTKNLKGVAPASNCKWVD